MVTGTVTVRLLMHLPVFEIVYEKNYFLLSHASFPFTLLYPYACFKIKTQLLPKIFHKNGHFRERHCVYFKDLYVHNMTLFALCG